MLKKDVCTQSLMYTVSIVSIKIYYVLIDAELWIRGLECALCMMHFNGYQTISIDFYSLCSVCKAGSLKDEDAYT